MGKRDLKPAERSLVLLLRAGGVITGSAIFAVFLPDAWMASTHEQIGLGPFPASPITDYLARSLSLFYAAHGALLFVVASDIRRFRPVALYCGWFGVLGGGLILWIDLHAHLPLWWVLMEGPWVVAIGVLILLLARHVERS
jgi:hypothetical protein